MSFIANTAFEAAVTNQQFSATQNVAGTFVTVADSVATPADCSAGFLVQQYKLMDNDGYTGVLNGNTWQFQVAADNTEGAVGAGGIFAFNSYDVNKVADPANAANIYQVGARTLGIGLPEGEVGVFTQIIPGEQYAFGAGNFSTAPTGATTIYCTITNGLLVASATPPTAASGLYFKLLRQGVFTEGTWSGGTKYVCRALIA